MATDLRNLPAYLGDDATFRSWGLGLAAQFAAIGLVQTADTGQINWATVARPAINTVAGYEIWRFNDALQATKPVYIRFEYAVGSNQDRPRLNAIVSTGTNGAGTSTGQVGVARNIPSSTSRSVGITYPSYCSGSSSRLNLCTNLDTTSTGYAMLHLIERTKQADGTETGDGIVAFSQGASSSFFQILPFIGSPPSTGTANLALPLSTGNLSTFGVDVALSPTVCFLGKSLFASWCCYIHTDIGELSTFTMQHLGATHTYLPLGDGIPSGTTNHGGIASPTHSLAMLWE